MGGWMDRWANGSECWVSGWLGCLLTRAGADPHDGVEAHLLLHISPEVMEEALLVCLCLVEPGKRGADKPSLATVATVVPVNSRGSTTKCLWKQQTVTLSFPIAAVCVWRNPTLTDTTHKLNLFGSRQMQSAVEKYTHDSLNSKSWCNLKNETDGIGFTGTLDLPSLEY